MTTFMKLNNQFESYESLSDRIAKSDEVESRIFARLGALHFLVEAALLAEHQGSDSYAPKLQEAHRYRSDLVEWWKEAAPDEETWLIGMKWCKLVIQRMDFQVARTVMLKGEGEPDEFFKKAYTEVGVFVHELRTENWRPRLALTLGVAGVEQLSKLAQLTNQIHRMRKSHQGETPSPKEEDPELINTMAHYVGKFHVIDGMVELLEGLGEILSKGSTRERFTPQALRLINIEDGVRDEVVDDLLIPPHRTLRALFEASSLSKIPLPHRAWRQALKWFPYVRPEKMPGLALAQLRDAEIEAFRISLADSEWQAEELTSYVENRLEQLDDQSCIATLAASEKRLFAGWSNLLLVALRHHTDDLADLSPRRALELIDRSGASAYRAETTFYSRLRAITDIREEELEDASDRSPSSQAGLTDMSDQELVALAYVAREGLDIWGFHSLLHNLRDTSWSVEPLFGELLDSPPAVGLQFPHSMAIEEIAEMMGVSSEALNCEVTQNGQIVRIDPEAMKEVSLFAHAQHVAEMHRQNLSCFLQELKQRGAVEPSDFASARVDADAVIETLRREPKTALLLTGAPPAEFSALNVFALEEDALVRRRIAAPDNLESYGERFGGFLQMIQKLNADIEQPGPQKLNDLGEAIEEVISAFQPWGNALADTLDDLGVEKVLIMPRGLYLPQLPLEAISLDGGRGLFGDHFTTAYVPTVAELDEEIREERARKGQTLQVFGDGLSREQMVPGRQVQEALFTGDDNTLAPMSAAEIGDEGSAYESLSEARRLRVFAHGRHDIGVPFRDHLALSDGDHPMNSAMLDAADIRRMALVGMESVELFVCEGLAHTRPIHAAGAVDEPADIAHSFLIAGARQAIASIWPAVTVPAALFMERFALYLHAGMDEVDALAHTRRAWLQWFATEGVVERGLQDTLEEELIPLADKECGLSREARHDVMTDAFSQAIEELRASWYGQAGLESPTEPLQVSKSLRRMADFRPPRSQQLAEDVRNAPGVTISELVGEILAPYRNPLCWAGWRVLLRSISSGS